MNKDDYFNPGAQGIIIFNDAKNMNTFIKSNLNDVKNHRLFKMLERTLMYNFAVKYKPGYRMGVVDWGFRNTRSRDRNQYPQPFGYHYPYLRL